MLLEPSDILIFYARDLTNYPMRENFIIRNIWKQGQNHTFTHSVLINSFFYFVLILKKKLKRKIISGSLNFLENYYADSFFKYDNDFKKKIETFL